MKGICLEHLLGVIKLNYAVFFFHKEYSLFRVLLDSKLELCTSTKNCLRLGVEEILEKRFVNNPESCCFSRLSQF